MNFKGWTFLTAAIAVCTTFISKPALAQDAMAAIKQKGALIVGVKTDYKPWGFIDPSGKVIGLEIDLATEVASKLGVKLELVPVIASNRLEFLQQGRIDLLIATLGDNAQRRKAVGMIEPNYYASGANLMAKKQAGLKSWTDLKGRNVCAIQGSYYNRRVTEQYGANLVAFTGVSESLNALQQGNCIAFLYDNTFIESTLSGSDPKWADYEMPLPTEDPAPWAIAVRLDDLNGPWGAFLKDQVTSWHKSGRLLELEKKWGIKQSPFLTEQNKKYSAS